MVSILVHGDNHFHRVRSITGALTCNLWIAANRPAKADLRLNTELVIDCMYDSLPGAKISFRGF